jgi:hypothetical protein
MKELIIAHNGVDVCTSVLAFAQDGVGVRTMLLVYALVKNREREAAPAVPVRCVLPRLASCPPLPYTTAPYTLSPLHFTYNPLFAAPAVRSRSVLRKQLQAHCAARYANYVTLS